MNKRMTEQELMEMKLHETKEVYADDITHKAVTRVVKGWIYDTCVTDDNGAVSISSVFVPERIME